MCRNKLTQVAGYSAVKKPGKLSQHQRCLTLWILNHISRSTTWSLFTLKALTPLNVIFWSFQFIDWLKFENRPSSLCNFEMAYSLPPTPANTETYTSLCCCARNIYTQTRWQTSRIMGALIQLFSIRTFSVHWKAFSWATGVRHCKNTESSWFVVSWCRQHVSPDLNLLHSFSNSISFPFFDVRQATISLPADK